MTPWLHWFLGCLLRAVQGADAMLAGVLNKAQFWQRWAGTPMNARQTLVLNRVLDGMEGKLTNAKWAAMAVCNICRVLRLSRSPVESNADEPIAGINVAIPSCASPCLSAYVCIC